MKLFENIINKAVMVCMGAIVLVSCTDDNDWSVESAYDRLFGPNESEIAVKPDATGAEVTFTTVKDAENYIIQVSNDSLFDEGVLTFGEDTKITKSPIYIDDLESDTTYFLRIKSIREGMTESNWARLDGHFKTKSEQILEPLDEANDLTATSVTLHWPANAKVTTVKCNGQTYTLTAEQIAAGTFTVTGLEPETEYTANIYNGSKKRGGLTFTTAIDLNGAILVNVGDDLKDVIENAEDGATLALMPGTYEVLSDDGSATSLNITKNVTIKSLRSYDRAVIKGGFTPKGGTLNLKQLVLNGDGAVGYMIDFKEAADYGDYDIDDCEITNYSKGLMYNNTTGAKVTSMVFNNCLIHDMGSGADFLDIRKGYIAALTFSNNTVWKADAARDFVRYDNKASDYPGAPAPVITVDHNTLVGIANTESRRLLYVRYADNTCIWTNNIVVDTKGIVTNQSSTNVTTISGNNNVDCPNLSSATSTVSSAKVYDDDATTLDPQFADADNGDFTVDNALLLQRGVGDPRWIK
ncbi:MAG: DUF4957 domain-containing protein [Prevotella sp.]|jgi:hypothetical protein